MQRLALGPPTALQLYDGHAILFHEGGTSRFLDLTDDTTYKGLASDNPSCRIWALFGSSQILSEPAPTSCADSPYVA